MVVKLVRLMVLFSYLSSANKPRHKVYVVRREGGREERNVFHSYFILMYKSSETRQYGMEGEERVQVQKLSDFELSSILFSYFTFHFSCTQSACALLTLIS